MKQTLMQKLLDKIYPILRKITGHKYGCCNSMKRCSKCKYVKGGGTDD